MMLTRRYVLTAAALAVFAGCSSGPKVRTDGDPGANLRNYKTFGYLDRLGTDRGAYSSILSTRLTDATRRQLEQRGYRYSQSNPDLWVNFYVHLQNRSDVQSTPSTSAFYGYRAGLYRGWVGYPQDVETVNYQEGTLSIDLVDAAKKQLVWHGVAQGRITKAVLDDPAATIDRSVSDIFAKYPIAPSGAQ